jgi:hypothetical protein
VKLEKQRVRSRVKALCAEKVKRVLAVMQRVKRDPLALHDLLAELTDPAFAEKVNRVYKAFGMAPPQPAEGE